MVMEDESGAQVDSDDLYKRFEALFSGSDRTEDEKQELSREVLKIVFESNEVKK